jgi:hypothetical protein
MAFVRTLVHRQRIILVPRDDLPNRPLVEQVLWTFVYDAQPHWWHPNLETQFVNAPLAGPQYAPDVARCLLLILWCSQKVRQHLLGGRLSASRIPMVTPEEFARIRE